MEFRACVDRLTSLLAAHYLEMVDARLKDSPHERVAGMVGDGDRHVLEVCAATGFLSRIVAIRLPQARVSALDLSAEMLAQGRLRARRLPNLDFVQGDATAMPYPECSFDVVLAAFGLSVLSAPVRSRCLREIRRVLTEPGRLLVVDADDPVPRARPSVAQAAFLRRRCGRDVAGTGLVRQLETHGFRPVHHVTGQGRFLPFQIIVAHTTRAGTAARTTVPAQIVTSAEEWRVGRDAGLGDHEQRGTEQRDRYQRAEAEPEPAEPLRGHSQGEDRHPDQALESDGEHGPTRRYGKRFAGR